MQIIFFLLKYLVLKKNSIFERKKLTARSISLIKNTKYEKRKPTKT